MPTHPAVCHRCSVSHQYSAEMLWRPNLETADFAFIDLYDYSCLNGWAMGNIAASARDLSMFFRDLFSPTPHAPGAKPMLSPQSRNLMTDPKKMRMLSNSWWAGHTNDTCKTVTLFCCVLRVSVSLTRKASHHCRLAGQHANP